MKSIKPLRIRYLVFIMDGGVKYYLRDWIIADKRDHLVFDVELRYATKFKDWDAAYKMRERMVKLNYHPHIEQVM